MVSSITNTNSFICTQLSGFKYSKWLNSFIWPIDETLISTITLGQSDNKGIFHIPQNSRIGASSSDGLVSYPGHLLRGSYPSAEMQLAYSLAPAE